MSYTVTVLFFKGQEIVPMMNFRKLIVMSTSIRLACWRSSWKP